MPTPTAFRAVAVLCVLGSGCIDAAPEDTDGSSTQGAEATTDAVPECETQSFEPLCVEGDLLFCSEEGTVTRRSCGDGGCVLGSEGAGCVWPLDEPCEGEYSVCKEPGGVHACLDGVWRFESCPPGGSCAGDTCYGPDAVPCTPGDRRCDADTLWVCNGDGFEVEQTCGPEDVCRVGIDGPGCFSADAEPCDPETFVSECAHDGLVVHCFDGWTSTVECDVGERCFASELHAGCFDQTAEACDPTTAAPVCDAGVAGTCSIVGAWTEAECHAEELCVTGQWCGLSGDCLDAAACVPEDAPPCEEVSRSFCDGLGLSYCFGGYALPLVAECDCVEAGGQATCS